MSRSKVRREKKTVAHMVAMYCRASHGTRKGLCNECSQLLAYANARVDACPFVRDKPTCLNCVVHCYEKSRREKIRTVMRYSGPRMLTKHPILAILHLIDGRRRPRKPSVKE